MPTFHFRVPVQVTATLHFQSSFLLTRLRDREWQPKSVGSCHSCGRPILSYLHPGPSPTCKHVGSEPVHEDWLINLSPLCHFPLQINQSSKKICMGHTYSRRYYSRHLGHKNQGQQVKPLLETPSSQIGVTVWVLVTPQCRSSLGSKGWSMTLGSCHPGGKQKSSWLLTAVWPNPSSWGHLGSKPVDV